jgi:translation initiation factor 2 beta subunit (eIF-2beta)/eIF-5
MPEITDEELGFLAYLLKKLMVDPRVNYGEKTRVREVSQIADELARDPQHILP